MDGGVVFDGCGFSRCLDFGPHDEDQGWDGDHADARPHAGLRGDDCAIVAGAVGESFHLRHWTIRTASHRRLARRPIWQADAADQGIYRHHQANSRSEKPLEFHGDQYSIPYDGPDATGLGRPLRSIAHGDPNVPFYTASITPAGLRMAGEVADGNLPIFFSPDAPDVVTGPTLEGRKKAGKTMDGFDTAPFVRAKMGPDVAACRDAIRPELALYIGGMGARTKNFYNDMVSKMGFEGEARAIQDFYLDGKKNEAAAAVPDALIDAISLCGPAERIKDRLAAWKDVAKAGHVGTMVLKGSSIDVLRVVAEAVL